ncbi:MAG: metallophosphoesterase family protein [Candidatus Omnitrophica bacterium]|nr:metallophosphoesterase family protein [Candidatus Omnitrophota bacterium]
MKYAIFGDVHSNYEALTTFLAYIDSNPGLQPICVGDIAGYSSRPNECIQFLLERKTPWAAGNHDYAMFCEKERENFNIFALEVIEWQAGVLLPEYLAVLENLPFTLQIDESASITHSDFSAPKEFLYVTDLEEAAASMNAMPTPLGFFGHTHIPVVYTQPADPSKKEGIDIIHVEGDEFALPLDDGLRYLVNPGSLGQPRDGDPRSSFVIWDAEERRLTFRRLEYDNRAEYRHMLEAKIPSMLAERILEGY